jgi:hypothetical protein
VSDKGRSRAKRRTLLRTAREAVIEKNADLVRSGRSSKVAEALVWPALLRKLDRPGSNFRD